MSKRWTRDRILETAKSFQPACVLAAAADWDVFTTLDQTPMTATSLAERLGVNCRATTVLLDALVAMDLLGKSNDAYSVPSEVSELLASSRVNSVLPMVQHHANCLRRWAQLSRVIRGGVPAERIPSVRGEAADREAFISAMHTVSGPGADDLVAETGPPQFQHLLDIGGASGTWTIAFLRACPEATATIFDLPNVIPQAEKRIRSAGMADRTRFVSGDFYTDELPPGADFTWLSAIAHQNSRQQNRDLFLKISRALANDGWLMIRDIVMEESRTQPVAGAMFAVNMLVATEGGGTYTYDEYCQDLASVGFRKIELVRRDAWMNSIIRARNR